MDVIESIQAMRTMSRILNVFIMQIMSVILEEEFKCSEFRCSQKVLASCILAGMRHYAG